MSRPLPHSTPSGWVGNSIPPSGSFGFPPRLLIVPLSNVYGD